MNISKYQIFLKVVSCGSFSKAAEALSYTPSGVNQLGRRRDGAVPADGRDAQCALHHAGELLRHVHGGAGVGHERDEQAHHGEARL